MSKPINVYNLGEEGINVDSDDIHVRDGELLSAQNWQIDPAGGLGGIRRRDGMAALNGTPLAGSVTGIIALPLPDRSGLTTYLYAPIDSAAANHFRKSTDGTTWTNSTEGVAPASRDDMGALGTGAQELYTGAMRWQGFKNKLYYPGHDYTTTVDRPTIHVWDGTTDYLFANIPQNPNSSVVSLCVLSMIPYSDTQLLVSTYDDTTGNGRGRVLLVDVTTGAFATLGPETDLPGLPLNMVVWQGKIWTGLVNTGGGSATTVRWTRPTDAAWTTDLTTAVSTGYCIDLAIFQGNLYAGFASDVGGGGIIKKRTSDGAWSTVKTSDGTGANNFLGPFVVNADDTKIFAFWSSVSGGASPVTAIYSSTDGTTWAVDYNIESNLGAAWAKTGMPIRDSAGIIYWPVKSTGASDKILKRTAAGVWSIVDTADLRGPIGIIKF